MKLVYKMVIENKHVKRLVNAAPGVQELFFLGRLLWLVCLAEAERGWSYDHVIVDAPAMGHGVSLFKIAPTIASFGMTGPLATECERVTKMLRDDKLVGTVVVTIPEEMPVAETVEFLPQITEELQRPPLFCVLNRSFVQGFDESEVDRLLPLLETDGAKVAMEMLATDLKKRESFSEILSEALLNSGTPLLRSYDVHLRHAHLTPSNVLEAVSQDLKKSLFG